MPNLSARTCTWPCSASCAVVGVGSGVNKGRANVGVKACAWLGLDTRVWARQAVRATTNYDASAFENRDSVGEGDGAKVIVLMICADGAEVIVLMICADGAKVIVLMIFVMRQVADVLAIKKGDGDVKASTS